ncbi:hypothetical protein H9P43_009447 [Blastocladiella emersonii ATCC 22665]|nr:hypothetical protein H9P43_009447 [Blastocladiella emersonii ATCC 22665]
MHTPSMQTLVAAAFLCGHLASLAAAVPAPMPQNSPGSSAAPSFGTVVVFGDEWTDTGNAYNALTDRKYPPAAPLYDNGRFSNGAMWPEYLADFMSTADKAVSTRAALQNYAHGGATTNDSLVHGHTGEFYEVASPGVNMQLAMYESHMDSLLPGPRNATLYAVWAGAQDAFFNLTLAQPKRVVDNLMSAVERIDYLSLTKFKLPAYAVVVLNMPPLGTLPMFNRMPAAKPAFNAFSVEFNKELAAQVAAMNTRRPAGAPEIKIANVDMGIEHMSQEPAFYNLPPSINGTVRDSCLHRNSATGALSMCQVPGAHIYWDDNFALTTRAHRVIARVVAALFGVDILPLP